VTVDIEDWDTKRERCKTNTIANAKIEEVRKKIQHYIETTGCIPEKKHIEKEGREAIQDLIEEKRLSMVAMNSSENSWRSYTTLSSLVRRYTEETKRKEVYVDEITTNYIDKFIEWMVSKDYASSHITKMTRILRTVTRERVSETQWRKAKIPKNQFTEMIYLSKEEIEKIERFNIDQNDSLSKVRDLFLIGCYTALRYSDWRKVDETRVKTIGNVRILIITQQKTGGQTTLPITDKLNAIMQKYKADGIPKLSNQKFNQRVKELCRKAGITQNVAYTEYRGGKIISITAPKWTLISSHTARRSFATNAVMAGIPFVEVMKFTGHKSMAAFMQYVRTTGQEAAVNYANHPFFTQ